MEFLGTLFNTILYKPLFNLLVIFYNYLPGHDFGIAIIILTILIRLALYPFGAKAIRSQKALSELQPKIKEVQEKHKDDKEKQVKAVMELYKKEKINPFSGFLVMIIQLPIFFALYQVCMQGFHPQELSKTLYGFMPHVDKINPLFLNLLDLSKSAAAKINGEWLWLNIILVILVGATQFIQMKMTMPQSKTKNKKKDDISVKMQSQMIYFFPIFTLFILWSLPAALGLYWLITTLFSIIQQYFILKKAKTV